VSAGVSGLIAASLTNHRGGQCPVLATSQPRQFCLLRRPAGLRSPPALSVRLTPSARGVGGERSPPRPFGHAERTLRLGGQRPLDRIQSTLFSRRAPVLPPTRVGSRISVVRRPRLPALGPLIASASHRRTVAFWSAIRRHCGAWRDRDPCCWCVVGSAPQRAPEWRWNGEVSGGKCLASGLPASMVGRNGGRDGVRIVSFAFVQWPPQCPVLEPPRCRYFRRRHCHTFTWAVTRPDPAIPLRKPAPTSVWQAGVWKRGGVGGGQTGPRHRTPYPREETASESTHATLSLPVAAVGLHEPPTSGRAHEAGGWGASPPDPPHPAPRRCPPPALSLRRSGG